MEVAHQVRSLSTDQPLAPDRYEAALVSKVRWRLIPFMFVLYIVAYIDRVNVGLRRFR